MSKSPFPGTDPYLETPSRWESRWEEFHSDCNTEFKRALAPQLGQKYEPRSEVMLIVHEPPETGRAFAKADAGVATRDENEPFLGGAVALAEPSTRTQLEPYVEVERHRYIEIRTREDERPVTAIELLSPSNKRDRRHRAQYLAKREVLVAAGVHLLQIDLLRGGPRLLPEPAAPHDYDAMLSRAEDQPAVDVWFWNLRERLPALPVPLLAPDPDVSLDLQAIFGRVYDGAGYGANLYRYAPDPPLSPEAAAWAETLLSPRKRP